MVPGKRILRNKLNSTLNEMDSELSKIIDGTGRQRWTGQDLSTHHCSTSISAAKGRDSYCMNDTTYHCNSVLYRRCKVQKDSRHIFVTKQELAVHWHLRRFISMMQWYLSSSTFYWSITGFPVRNFRGNLSWGPRGSDKYCGQVTILETFFNGYINSYTTYHNNKFIIIKSRQVLLF